MTAKKNTLDNSFFLERFGLQKCMPIAYSEPSMRYFQIMDTKQSGLDKPGMIFGAWLVRNAISCGCSVPGPKPTV